MMVYLNVEVSIINTTHIILALPRFSETFHIPSSSPASSAATGGVGGVVTRDAPAATRPHYRSFRWTISEVADSTTAAGRVQLAEITLLGKHDFQPIETAFIAIIPLVFIAAVGVVVGVRKSKNYLFTYPLLERLMIAYCFVYLILIPLAIATPLTAMVTGPLFALGVPVGLLALWLTKDVALPGVFSGTKYKNLLITAGFLLALALLPMFVVR